MKIIKIIISVILFLLAACCLLLLFVANRNQWMVILLSVVLISIGILLIFFDSKRLESYPLYKKLKSHLFNEPQNNTPIPSNANKIPDDGANYNLHKDVNEPQNNTSIPQNANKIPDGCMNYNLFEDVEENTLLCYDYEENLCLIDGAITFISGCGGKPVSFTPEPENPYDSNAICIMLNGKKIGYVYRGLIQDMCNDYLKRGWPVIGYINKYSVSENKATYKIGFYKPFECFENREFSLIKTSKKINDYYTRQDYLCRCDVGDIVYVIYDKYEEIYIVCSDDEIGELPKSATNFIRESNYKKIVGIISKCDVDDNDKYKASVTLYIVK